MRTLTCLAIFALMSSAWAAGPVLMGGDLAVPLPPGWVVWTDEEIEAANPTLPEDQTLLSQGAGHRFGHPGFNPTLTLTRLAPDSAPGRAPDAQTAAQALRRELLADAQGAGIAATEARAIYVPGAGAVIWTSALPLTVDRWSMDVLVTQAVIDTEAGRFLLTGLAASGELSPDYEALIGQVEVAGQITPRQGLFGPPTPERALWGIEGFKLPVPEGWAAWVRVADAATPEEVAGVRAGISRLTPSPSGFVPTMAMEIAASAADAADLVADCRRTAGQLESMISEGTWLREPEPLTLMGRSAAWAWIGGVMPVHRVIVTVQLCDLRILDGERVIRVVAVMEHDDSEALSVLESMLNLDEVN